MRNNLKINSVLPRLMRNVLAIIFILGSNVAVADIFYTLINVDCDQDSNALIIRNNSDWNEAGKEKSQMPNTLDIYSMAFDTYVSPSNPSGVIYAGRMAVRECRINNNVYKIIIQSYAYNTTHVSPELSVIWRGGVLVNDVRFFPYYSTGKEQTIVEQVEVPSDGQVKTRYTCLDQLTEAEKCDPAQKIENIPERSYASFNCSKAESQVEKLICSENEMKSLDRLLDAIYRNMLKQDRRSNSLREMQRQWMKKRNECQNIGCMKETYINRIFELTATPTKD
ncbi:lysozyme inhibitor LprI family protein [Sideroxydans lithotrophicus]|uniref:Lysozyme inhibitor LprI-like N-terminal domain-containing protein n=1 Tax=Sideroxydans lithotrophicus (strain ES-1) TaxID=580332 RepID=D5CSB0_SIDLE|nr:lysozyme inhibitor LprI family protein [Sideroxydans lithotrophicus]ADE11846.1 protein of unknown function DUF1311 [Sideroxydans lithotrophicus ES-1]